MPLVFNRLFPAIYHTIISQKITVSSPCSFSTIFSGKRITGEVDFNRLCFEEAYGPVKDDLFQEIPKSQFPSDVDVKPGMAFEAQGPQGSFMITITEVNDNDTVTVDLNHPMAGKQLHFDVNVIEVREPGAEELAQAAARASSGCGCGCGPDGEDACGSGCNCG